MSRPNPPRGGCPSAPAVCEVGARAELGNATVGFVASVGLLLMVVYTIIAAGLGWYVHAIATDSAMEGARAGAIAGSPDLAVARTRELMSASLSPSYISGVSAAATATGIEVVVHAPIPGAGFLGTNVIEVRAHADAK